MMLQQALADLNTAHRNFFQLVADKRGARSSPHRGTGPARTIGMVDGTHPDRLLAH
ncbi:hypothetical protein [Nocardia sp. NPDC049707]|uniref:hypothetical protein n=1 Tax=Nocardia sp. NPDC049707 TaxID=3154735 RepID=UPI003439AAC4